MREKVGLGGILRGKSGYMRGKIGTFEELREEIGFFFLRGKGIFGWL